MLWNKNHKPTGYYYLNHQIYGGSVSYKVTDACTECGICATACPSNAIDEENGFATIAADCILCCACIKACPEQARVMKDGPIKDKARWLNETCSTPKPVQVFFATES